MHSSPFLFHWAWSQQWKFCCYFKNPDFWSLYLAEIRMLNIKHFKPNRTPNRLTCRPTPLLHTDISSYHKVLLSLFVRHCIISSNKGCAEACKGGYNRAFPWGITWWLLKQLQLKGGAFRPVSNDPLSIWAFLSQFRPSNLTMFTVIPIWCGFNRNPYVWCPLVLFKTSLEEKLSSVFSFWRFSRQKVLNFNRTETTSFNW